MEMELESISRIGGIDGVNQSCEADSISSIFPTDQCSSDIFDSMMPMPLLFSSTTSTFDSISSFTVPGPQPFRPPALAPALIPAYAPAPAPIHLVLLDPTDISYQGESTECTVGDRADGGALWSRRNSNRTMESARMCKTENINNSIECCIDRERKDDQKQLDKSTLSTSTSISPVSLTIPSLPGPEGAMSPTLPSQPIFTHFHSHGSDGYGYGKGKSQKWGEEVKYAQKMAFKKTAVEPEPEPEQEPEPEPELELYDTSERGDSNDKNKNNDAMDMGTDTVRFMPKVRISKYPRSSPSPSGGGGSTSSAARSSASGESSSSAGAEAMIGGGTGMRGRRWGPAVDPLFSAPSSSSSSSSSFLTSRNLLSTSTNSNSNSITFSTKNINSREDGDRYLSRSRSPPPPYPTSFLSPAPTPALFNPMFNYTDITDNGTHLGPFNTSTPTPTPLPLPLPVTLCSPANKPTMHDHKQSIPSSYPSISSSQHFMSRSVLEFMRVEEELRIDEEKGKHKEKDKYREKEIEKYEEKKGK